MSKKEHLYYAIYSRTKAWMAWQKEATFLELHKASRAREYFAKHCVSRTFRIVEGRPPFPEHCDDHKMLDWSVVA